MSLTRLKSKLHRRAKRVHVAAAANYDDDEVRLWMEF